ncbi:MAG: hypothetical protein JNL79_31130 [Myxococcales bacterium]|nr:hypothetical protein [Myxococcales bacterium]
MRSHSWFLLFATLLAGCVGAFEPSEETTATDHTVAPLASASASTSGEAPPAPGGSVAPPQVTTPTAFPERKLDRPPPHPALPDPAAEEPVDNPAATIPR